MAGTTIYSTVANITTAADAICQLGGGFDDLFLNWLNEGQLEMESLWRQNGIVYEALRTAGQSGASGAIGALTAGEEDYAFVSRIAAVDLDTVRDDTNPITYRREEEIRRILDRAWDDTGNIYHFSMRPSAFKFWRIPNQAYIDDHPIVYFDYYTRLNQFTLTTDPLTQYYEHDRLVLLKYLIFRAYQQMDDTREDRARAEFEDMVMSMGCSGNIQGIGGPPTEIGMGPYFDDHSEW